MGQHQAYIHIIGIPEVEDKEKRAENLFEEIVWKLSYILGKETNIQEARSPKQNEPKEIYIKTHFNLKSKVKDKESLTLPA